MTTNCDQMGLIKSDGTLTQLHKETDFHKKHGCRNASRPLKFKKVLDRELKLSNKFENLLEEGCIVKQTENVDENTNDRIFFIGKMNIFKSKKPIKAWGSTNLKGEIKIAKNKRRTSCLRGFESVNQFDVLADNSEEEVAALIKRLNILKASKSSMKKCRTCNKKRRICALDQTKCRAVTQFCYYCNKIGHSLS